VRLIHACGLYMSKYGNTQSKTPRMQSGGSYFSLVTTRLCRDDGLVYSSFMFSFSPFQKLVIIRKSFSWLDWIQESLDEDENFSYSKLRTFTTADGSASVCNWSSLVTASPTIQTSRSLRLQATDVMVSDETEQSVLSFEIRHLVCRMWHEIWNRRLK
jgi:hypothetical protein